MRNTASQTGISLLTKEWPLSTLYFYSSDGQLATHGGEKNIAQL